MIISKRFIGIFSLAKVADAAAVKRDIRQLLALADHASSVRRLDIVSQIARELQKYPLPEGVAEFYTALTLPDDIKARMLAKIAESAPDRYRARALTNFAGLRHDSGDHAEGLALYIEAQRICADPFVKIAADRMVAVVAGLHGDHDHALRLLESGLASAREISRNTPALFLDYLNSYAVELAAEGRVEEAGRIARRVVASPASARYPEWRETLEEIRRPSSEAGSQKSAVAVSAIRNSEPEIGKSYTNILQFMPRRKPETINQKPETSFELMSEREKRLALVAMILNQAPGADLKALWDALPDEERSRAIIDVILNHGSEATLDGLYRRMKQGA